MSLVARSREFVKEVRAESGKVSWPSRSELKDSTIVVIGAVVIVAAFIYVVDSVLRLGIGLLFR